MSSFELKIDPREAQYARFAGAVLKALRAAVFHRVESGLSQREICDRIGMDKGYMSRILNGRVPNLTLRTVSDVLWATEHEPVEFEAEAIEQICPNYCPVHLRIDFGNAQALAGNNGVEWLDTVRIGDMARVSPGSNRLGTFGIIGARVDAAELCR
jgi:hypothetical protein